jgi:hypothetical protein
MPPVVVALIPIVAAVAVIFVKSAIVKALILIAAFVATTLLTKRKPKGNRINQGAELSTKINPSLPRTICIGQTAIGPSCHFAFTYTDNADKPNRYLMRVLQISDQPINSLLAIYDGKQVLTFTGDVTTGWFACNAHKNKDGAACMWMRVYKGVHSGAVADATLVSNSGGQWTSSHKGTGICYAIVKYDYDADAFPNGEPELVFAVQGAKVYDDRFDSTKTGGSGTQRVDTPTTWAYTPNTAVNIAQYLRGFKINGKRIMGVGAEEADLYTPMLFSAFNTCDQTVNVTGGTEKRYYCGMNLASDETAEDHLTDLALAMDGKVFDRGGAITLWPGAVRTPVMNISEQDIDWSAEKSWQPHAGLNNLINSVQGNFVDPVNFYQERDLPVRTNSTWETDDGGQRFSTFVSLRAVRSWAMGQRITKRIHDASRFNGVAAFTGGIWLIQMEQGDWFTLTHSRWDMTAKYFEVREITLTSDMRVAIVAEEVSTTLDSWAPASDEFARTDTYWNGGGYDLPIPTFSLEPYNYLHPGSGVQQFGITFILITPSGQSGTFVQWVEVQYAKVGETANPIIAGNVTLDLPRLTVLGLEPDADYLFRARCCDGIRFGEWSAWPVPGGATPTDPPDTTIVDDLSALAGIASDDIITKLGEKLKLKVRALKLYTKYATATARADVRGVPYTTVTAAKANWEALLASYNPAWDKENEDTYLYLTAQFPDKLFPTGWTVNNSLATAAEGGYTRLTDNGATARYISRNFANSGAKTYSAGIIVKKDAVGKATRNPILRLTTTSGTAKTATLAFDTSTGEMAKDANAIAGEVIDMGTDWYVYLTMTDPSGNNTVEFQIYPAGSTNLGLTVVNGTTGNIAARVPALAEGDWKTLGGYMMVARESNYQLLLDKLDQAISTRDNAWEDASTGVQIGGTPNLPPVIAVGTSFVFTGTITYSATPTSATISVTAGNAVSGNTVIPYSAMSKVVTGTANTTVQYYLYIHDPLYAGGAQTLQASTVFDNTADDDGSIYIGFVTVVFPAIGGGTSSGGGGSAAGSYCVEASMKVYTARGWIPAGEVEPGDYVRVLTSGGKDLTWVPVDANNHAMQQCYKLAGTESDIEVTISETTPLQLEDGTLIYPEVVDGKCLPFVEGKEGADRLWYETVRAEALGLRPVCLIECNNGVYVAGKREYAGIATHNSVTGKVQN